MNSREQTIHRYLLGELTESEQAALEQEYFNDQRLFEQIVEVENELVDKYARGLLSTAMQARFKEYYLDHAQRRERARFAEALQAKLDQAKEVEAEASTATETWLERLSAALRGPRLAWAFSIAVLLIAVLGGWFFIETRRLRQELARTESERVAREGRERELQQQVTNEQVRAKELSQELERLRMQQVAAASPSPSPEDKLASTFATLILPIGGTRGADAAPPAVLKIPARTEQVRLQLNLRENNYSRYQAVLQSASGNTVFTSRQLLAPNKKSGANLSLIIPAQRFTTSDYILTLRGVSPTGEVEDVSKSLFRVERK
jgi:type IV secretory pathway VirB2 component (pilin)